VAAPGSAAARGSVVAGAASVATLPVAVYLTRYSTSYELLHAGFAIPLAVVFGVLALALARRACRRSSLSILSSGGSSGVATAGHVLGIVGLCLASSALVALGVYGLLEYVGSRG
jgi:hypothetical protein